MADKFGLSELPLGAIKARGWVKRYLETQAKGMTGAMHRIGAPFDGAYWQNDAEDDLKKGGYFVGGLDTWEERWVPFEQNGYWIDGMVRAGHLADIPELLELAHKRIYATLQNADDDGYMGPAALKNGMTWAHTIFLRSLMAEYTATHNEAVLEALKKHFLRKPLKEVYEQQKKKDPRNVNVRNIADIEIALWLYDQTGDGRFLEMAEASYEVYNEWFSDDAEAANYAETRDLTLPGMLSRRKANRTHGVTYNELCKLAAVLHLYTGKETYKKAAVNAFDKLYRDQMLVDGVHSSSEYLNGNTSPLAAHETCDVADFTWAVGYLYMITGDTKYSDWVENAIFNAGLASVDDDFKGNQYFSSPNQVLANDTSSHVAFYKGSDWMSFSPKYFLACCAGNVHRIMPNFVARAWMKKDNTLYAFTYAPCDITTEVNGHSIRVEEETNYPFENTVRLHFHAEAPVEMTLCLRKPDWATKATLCLNGKVLDADFTNGTTYITRSFCEGDSLTLSFEDEIVFIKNAGGVSVKKGALLYALPITERTVIEGLKELGNPDFPHYSLYPESKWNYGISLAQKPVATTVAVGEEGWRREQNGLAITLIGREVKNWKLLTTTKALRRTMPRGRINTPVGHEVTLTTAFPKVKPENLGAPETLTLVPYATTRLRIAIFPIVEE